MTTWWVGQIGASFLARVEQFLWLYCLPMGARFPVICFDERLCFLIGEAIAGLLMKAGKVAR